MTDKERHEMLERLRKEDESKPRRVFATKEEFSEWLDSIMGSITDETFFEAFLPHEDLSPIYSK